MHLWFPRDTGGGFDDAVYKTLKYEYGTTITPEPQPEGDYQSFEWIDMPQTMPAHDMVVP